MTNLKGKTSGMALEEIDALFGNNAAGNLTGANIQPTADTEGDMEEVTVGQKRACSE